MKTVLARIPLNNHPEPDALQTLIEKECQAKSIGQFFLISSFVFELELVLIFQKKT